MERKGSNFAIWQPCSSGISGGGFSISCAAAAAVSEVAATVAVNCTAATDDEGDADEEDNQLIGASEVTWRVSSSISSSSSSADRVSSISKPRPLSLRLRDRRMS